MKLEIDPADEPVKQDDSLLIPRVQDDFSPGVVVSPAETVPDRQSSPFRFNRLAFIITGTALFMIFLLGAGSLFLLHKSGNQDRSSGGQGGIASGYAGGSLSFEGGQQIPIPQTQTGQSDQLTINGQLKVENTLVLAPSSAPASPVAGQIYYDKTAGAPYYYNGTRFVSLAPSAAGVSSLGGVTGVIGLGNGLTLAGNQLAVTGALNTRYNAGPGIGLSGTTISNSGVISLAAGSSNLAVTNDGSGHYTVTDTSAASTVNSVNGTANQINVSSTTGDITLSLPQDIAVTSSPTFGGLAVNGNFLEKVNSTTAFQIQNAAGNSNLFVANTGTNRIGIGTSGPGYKLDVQGGDINTSGIYRVNGAQISSANLSNDSNLAKLNVSNTFSASNTFSGSVAIQGSNGLTLGSTGHPGMIIFHDGVSANTGTLQLAGTLSGNVTFSLPVATGPQTLCTVELGNCAGSGSGITGTGSLNHLARFTGGQTIGDSSISDDGSQVTISVATAIQGSDGLTLGASGVNGQLVFDNGSNTNTVTLQSGVTSGNLVFTLPTADGSDGDCLKTDGSGALVFSSCTGTGPGGGVTSVNTLTGVLSLQGTANQIDVSSAGSTITLSLPQNISTGSSATFRTVTLNGAAAGDDLIVANAVSGATGDLIDLKVNNVQTFTVDPGGNVNTTGQYQVNGAQISSANLSNDSDLAKLDGTGPQTFTGDNEFTGGFTLQNASDSTTAFQIQNQAGTSNLLDADTTNSRIGIGTLTPGYTLDVNGDINTTGVYRINGAAICTVSGCTAAAGSGSYIQNGTSPQTADFNITGSGTIGNGLTVSAGGATISGNSTITGVSLLQAGTSSSAVLTVKNYSTGPIFKANNGSGTVFSIDNNGDLTDNGAVLFKNASDSTSAFQVQNSNGSDLVVADTTDSRVGINTGSFGPSTNLTVYNGGESTTQTEFTQNMVNAGINLMTDYVQDAYTGGLFWSTQDNNPTSPKAGIYTQLTNSGSKLIFGTSSSYTAGITNDALTIGYDGDSVFRNGINSAAGFQVQDTSGAGLLTVNTSTGSVLTSSLYIDTLGSGSTTALCWNSVTLQVTSCASTGSIGFWNRTGTTLSPANAGDAISTTGTITGAALQSGSLDTASAAALNIGTTTQNALNIGRSVANTTVTGGNVFLAGNTSVLSGNTFSVQSGYAAITGLNTGSNTTLRVDNHTSTGKILELQDAATDVFTVADGGAVTAENTVDSTAAFQIQKSDSTPLFTADTSDMRIRIGDAGTPVGQLFVSGGAPAAATGSVTVAANGLQDVRVQGSYAYTIDYSDSLFEVVDVSDPASPSVIGSVSTNSKPQALYVAGHYAYVADDSGQALDIINISDPSAPALVGTIGLGHGGLTVTVSGKYAYVGTSGGLIRVIDVSNPKNPTLASSFSTSTPLALFVAGDRLYSVDAGSPGSLHILDISDPTNLSEIGSVSTGGSSECDSGGILAQQNVYVSGKYAYVTVCSTNTVQIFDVSDPASPAAVGSGISTGAGTGPLAVNIQGRYAYVGLYDSDQLATYDVSDPASPVLIGTTSNGAVSGPMAMAVQGRYTYVADWDDNKLNIYDLGGAYVQQLESGSEQTGQLSVSGNGSFDGDVSIQGGITIGTNAAINGALGVGGPVVFQNGVNSANAFRVQDASGSDVFSVDTTNPSGYASIDVGGTAAPYSEVRLQESGVNTWALFTDDGPSPLGAGQFGIYNYGTGDTNFALSSSGEALFRDSSDSSNGFQVQDAGGDSVLNVDTASNIVTVTAGTDAGVLGSELFTGGTSFPATTGWTSISGTGQTATATHASGTTALSPTPALAVSGGTTYMVTWDVTNPNSGGSLTITMGGQTVAAYDFNDDSAGSYTITDSAVITTSSSANLAFTPNSTFTGTVSDVSVKELTENWSPALVVNNTTGGNSIELRASSDTGNMFIGHIAGLSNVDGGGNTGLGSWALQNNVSGDGNTAVGSGALEDNVTGDSNVALGHDALENNTSGASNVALGAEALISNLQGSVNVAIGDSALSGNVDGGDNIAIGHNALQSNVSSWENVAIGSGSSSSFTGGGSNTAVGYATLEDNVSGYNNSSFGTFSLEHTTGNENAAFGSVTLRNDTTGSQNTAMGTYSLSGNTTGSNNVGLGYDTLTTNTTGQYNTALGDEADVIYGGLQGATAVGSGAAVGSNNTIILGYNANYGVNDNVGIGTSYAQNPFEVAPNTDSDGTITQSSGSGAVVGSGTSFSGIMVGGTIFYPDGGQGIVTAVTDATHLTSSNTTENVSGSDYAIVWGGFNVNSDASVWLQNTTDSSGSFSVVDASDNILLNVNTSNSSVNIAGVGSNGGGGRLTFGDYDPTSDNAAWVGEYGTSDTDILQLNGEAGIRLTAGSYSAPKEIGNFSYDSGRDSGVLALGQGVSGGYLEFDDSGAFKWSIGMDSAHACSGGTPSDTLYFYSNVAGGCALQFNSSGVATFKAANSNSAFQIQNGGGNALFNINSTGSAITLLGGVTGGTLTTDIAGTATSNAVCHSGGSGASENVQLVACTGSIIADYAENYPVASGVDYGDIVVTGSNMVNTYNTDADGNADWSSVKGQVTQLVKSSAPYQTNTIGIVSDNHNNFTSAGYNIKPEDNPMPIALNGRVPVNVSPSSGAVQPGDYLTTSGDSGKAMKATKAGFVIGKALEAWDPASGKTQVMVFVEPGYWPGPSQADYLQNGGDASLASLDVTGMANFAGINVSGTATVNDLTVTGSATVASLTVAGTADEFTSLTLTNAHFESTQATAPAIGAVSSCGSGGSPDAVMTGGSTDSAGSFYVQEGSSSPGACTVTITFTKPYSGVPKSIMLSPDYSLGGTAPSTAVVGTYVSKSANSFTFKLTGTGKADTRYGFDYWIIE